MALQMKKEHLKMLPERDSITDIFVMQVLIFKSIAI